MNDPVTIAPAAAPAPFETYWQDLLAQSAALRAYAERPRLKLRGLTADDLREALANAFHAGRDSMKEARP